MRICKFLSDKIPYTFQTVFRPENLKWPTLILSQITFLNVSNLKWSTFVRNHLSKCIKTPSTPHLWRCTTISTILAAISVQLLGGGGGGGDLFFQNIFADFYFFISLLFFSKEKSHGNDFERNPIFYR